MSGVVVGDTFYIGSRNMEPARLIAFDLTTGKVIARTDLGTGYSVQAMAVDSAGRYLYAGVLQKDGGPQDNLYRWDLTATDQPAQAIGRIGDRDVRDVAVAPDGVLYAVGGGSATAPALWQWDPATDEVTNCGVPDATSTLARAVAATISTVFFGGGSTLGGGGSAGRATLFAWDRSTKTFTSIVPTEMTADPSLRELAIIGDRLVAGSAGATENAKMAIIELADLGRYRLASLTGKVTKMYAADGDSVYYATAAGIDAISLTTAEVRTVTRRDVDLGEIWGVGVRDGKVLAASGYGFVAAVDPSSGAVTTTDLGDAGAPVDAQTCMGIASGGGFVYVGGNGVIARHALGRRGDVVNLRAPGEAKDAEVVNGVLYTGQYSGQGIWSYSPGRGNTPKQAAAFEEKFNRPLDTCWDDVHRLLLVGVQSDTEGGGALWTYDPRSKRSTGFLNPIDDVQLVRAVATSKGVAYLGGDNAQRAGARGTIVAFDPAQGRELWRIESRQTYGIGSLVARGRHLYGIALKGGFFVVDLKTRKIVHTANINAVCPQWSASLVNRGRVYAASDTTVVTFDPDTFAMTVVAPGLNGGWYSGCHLNVDERGRIYTLRDRNLVQIDDRR